MSKPFLYLFLLLSVHFMVAQEATVDQVDDGPLTSDLFDKCFMDKTLRIDYLLAGQDTTTCIFLWQIKEEPIWGGPRRNLLDPWNSGNFRYSIYDSATGELLYRKGFSTLFEEYQGTAEAKTVPRAYLMTATAPYPLRPVRFEIDKRSFATGDFESLFTLDIHPDSYFILHEPVDSIPVVSLSAAGDPATKLDIVFLAEGYTADEMSKFLTDACRIRNYFLSVSPFDEFRENIAFWAVESPSSGSGIDIPGKRAYVNTSFNSSFYTFDSDRYLTTPDTWSIHDAVAGAPYDQIIILNNSGIYGGGGFYNNYCQSTVDNSFSEIVTIHEFGHAFGGLADEYVGGVNYDGFYNLKTEPWEPNITTNVDFGSKWKEMIADSVPIPTPRDSIYQHAIGMFEGGGYMARGIYSPVMNCRMKDNSADGFCPACREAIRNKIRYYCD